MLAADPVGQHWANGVGAFIQSPCFATPVLGCGALWPPRCTAPTTTAAPHEEMRGSYGPLVGRSDPPSGPSGRKHADEEEAKPVMSAMQQPTEVAELDVRGFQCPFVLARAVHALADSPDGDLEVLSDHPTSVRTTVPAFCSKHGYT